MIQEMTYQQYMEFIQHTSESIFSECPVRKTLELLNGKWKLILIYELSKKNSYRFGESRKAIPTITNTMLTSALRELEQIDIVHREQYNEIPPHVEYSLTEKGKSFFPMFFEIAKWGEKYL
ncbi:winged helix-turn-helix transcriptional regulator [Pseudoflavonifractor phocaeensis]|uniref:winged helix-turn-helix transcriptional regulator n=1 Tax=Pseudoflavonifractor phocaeensis TaxID=1870988 RepID=UPI00210E0C7A|nr:helix-turn-helix domain-containing protein [Pseudoflavonifractor phocaeensis]MCQ4863828.1 helix-turn-helix transcriptional regulator [Pseudoflavonifractor phocaeensis]